MQADGEQARVMQYFVGRDEPAPAPEPRAAPQQVDAIRQQIILLYQQNAPAKLGRVDALLEEWKGREDELLDQIKRKYTGEAAATAGAAAAGGGMNPMIAPAPVQAHVVESPQAICRCL